jgi:hypothetical protein
MAQREKLTLVTRMKSSVMGFPGKTWGNRKILSMHKAADSDTNTERNAMIEKCKIRVIYKGA